MKLMCGHVNYDFVSPKSIKKRIIKNSKGKIYDVMSGRFSKSSNCSQRKERDFYMEEYIIQG